MIINPSKDHLEDKVSERVRILIVDDDPDILDSLKDIIELEMEDCTVSTVNNVSDAKILAQQFKPDIALLDIKIGQENGLELIPELKSMQPDITIVMMTAFRDNEYTVTAVRFGANDYLYKPIKPVELIQTITRLLQYQNFKREKIEADKRFHTLFEQATQWLFLLGKDGCLIDANQKAMDFIDKDKNSILGETFWSSPWFSSSVEAQEVIQAGLSNVDKGALFNSEFKVLDAMKNGLTFDLYMKPVVDVKNNVNQVVVECRDISDRKRAEDEIKILNTTLELRVKKRTKELEQSLILLTAENKERKKAEENAKRASDAKSDFLSRMSHELRTPMNAILGFGQLLEFDSDELDENQQSHVREIMGAGDHLLSLINEVLDLTEIESGSLEVSMQTVDLDDAVNQSLSLIKPLAEARDVKQINNISGQGFKLLADFTRLKQVLLNLLSNAVKYNSDKGVITLDAKVIDEQRLRISITDTGEGLTKEEIDKLFTSFERLNPKFNVEGTGIGLVITKSLVELMSGSIGVESTKGSGTTFWVELALA